MREGKKDIERRRENISYRHKNKTPVKHELHLSAVKQEQEELKEQKKVKNFELNKL